MAKKWQLQLILFLSVAGFLISLYLVQNHYAGATQGSVCDFGETISCSLVNTSIYSELWNVPVALLGVLWFIVAILLAWKGLKKPAVSVSLLVGWSVLGLLSVIYFVAVEIILKALCPFCTLIHVVVVVILLLSIYLYRKENKPTARELRRTALRWSSVVVVITALLLVLFNLSFGAEENYDEAAKCLTEKGVKMYSSFRCGVCAKTKNMFGDSFQYIAEIECHPQGPNTEFERCLQKQITGTPTWILEPGGQEVKRHTGFLSLEELEEFAGCTS